MAKWAYDMARLCLMFILSMVKILFVCLGNICRSPMAESIFNNLLNTQDLATEFACDSAGTSNYHIGENADKRTISTLTTKKLDIPSKARQITLQDLNHFDYIIAMDKNNYEDIQAMRPDKPLNKLYLLLTFYDKASDKDVPDPYYGAQDDFHTLYELLRASLESFLAYLRKKHTK